MKRNVLILGAGTAGTLVANLLVRKLDLAQWDVTLVDRAREHVYQPGLLFLPFRLPGYERREDVARPIESPLPREARFVNAEVQAIDTTARRVQTSAGTLDYEWLIVALGCEGRAGEVEGLVEAGKAGNAHTFYTLDGALAMQDALERMDGGHLVLDIADHPVKCPVAPIEFVFLADHFFRRRGRRDRIRITLVTPLTGCFTKPVATEVLSGLLVEKNIDVVPNFVLASVDGERRRIKAFDGRSIDYDLLVAIAPNLGPEVLVDAKLADESGFALTDPRTLKARKAANVYVIGDNTNVATSKAGSVAHFEAETVVENLLREMAGEKPLPSFDGHSNCFIETGFGKAMLIDFNYDLEPLPGKFPLPVVGPMTLLGESRLNHWGKLAFRWVYWNMLLPGRLSKVPLLSAKMSFVGKDVRRAPQVRRAHAAKVGQLMTKDVVTIGSGRPLGEAAELLTKHRISGLPVVDVDGRLVGLISEADFVSALDVRHPTRRKPMGTVVDDLMTGHPVTIGEDDTLEAAIERMEDKRVKRLVVVGGDDRVRGILARRDVLKMYTAK
ncbi:MAG: CBS domain-containing protein [Betaproteobacteria bacterium]|nr:CBS domain-containing protein [Betaproteobacteria bacterium]